MVELWTGLVHLLTPPSVAGNTMCYTNVVAWAQSPEDFVQAISGIFEKSNCSVLQVENCLRIEDDDDLPEELQEQVERAEMQPEDAIFGIMHYYPSKPT